MADKAECSLDPQRKINGDCKKKLVTESSCAKFDMESNNVTITETCNFKEENALLKQMVQDKNTIISDKQNLIALLQEKISHLEEKLANKNQGEQNKQSIAQHQNKPLDWKLGLLKTMNTPKSIVVSDKLVTMIADAYPKAEVHYLVLPKANIINLSALTPDHINLLQHMEEVAKLVIGSKGHTNRRFLLGFHAEPIMQRLHMHVISDDFNSPCIKIKRHWNSFNTEFFLKPEVVRKNLIRYGKANILTPDQCKVFLEAPLCCNKCDYISKNLTDLKQHIVLHKQNYFSCFG